MRDPLFLPNSLLVGSLIFMLVSLLAELLSDGERGN